MSVIRTHKFTLTGRANGCGVALRPLCDRHLPLLYRWYADPEVLYWTEGGADIPRGYDRKTVRAIYGGVSQNALCFLIEADGQPIGACWLQKMNLPEVRAMYPRGTDVRRIDLAIGEKSWRDRGLGTALVQMLAAFAFREERVAVLHCFNEDYNPRARRVWEKNGFALVLSQPLPQPQKGNWQHHFRLTREEWRANEQEGGA